MARRRMPAGLARFWRKKRAGTRRPSRRSSPKVRTRTRTRTVVKYRGRGRSRQAGFLNPVAFLTSLLVPAIGVAAGGMAARALPFLDTPVKRGVGVIAAALLVGSVGRKVGVPSGVANGLALGLGMDGVWRVLSPLRANIPALSGGGATGGLLAGRLSNGRASRVSRDAERAAAFTQ